MYFGFEDITIAFRSKTVLQHVTLDIPRERLLPSSAEWLRQIQPAQDGFQDRYAPRRARAV